jgi:hypothetical protein
MLTAYFDDSGTHEGSNVILAAGFIGSVEEWTRFDPAWRARLESEGLTNFHMTDCVVGKNQFATWREARRDLLIDDLSALLGSSDLLGINAVVHRADWESVVLGEFPDVVDVVDSPYYCVMSACIQQAILHMKGRYGAGEHIAIIYDDRPQDTTRQRNLPNLYEAHPFWGPSIVSISPGSSVKLPPLQAADLFANELYRNHVKWLKDPSAFHGHPRVVKICKSVSLAHGLINKESLRKQCSALRELRKRRANDA